MLKRLKNFCQGDSGAVTTDFLVLTAIVVTMALISLNAISTHSKSAALAAAAGIDTMGDDL